MLRSLLRLGFRIASHEPINRPRAASDCNGHLSFSLRELKKLRDHYCRNPRSRSMYRRPPAMRSTSSRRTSEHKKPSKIVGRGKDCLQQGK
jgi:hypothetical protein